MRPLNWRPRLKRSPRKLWRWSCIFLGLLTLLWGLSSKPAQSQLAPPSSSDKAAVVVDGRVVFEIYGTENLTAAERAYRINAALRQEVRQLERAEIEVVQDGSLIYLQSQNSEDILVTVTSVDVVTPGRTRREQAEIWARNLEAALHRGQQERSPTYLSQAALYSLILLAGAIAIYLILQVVRRIGSQYLNRWFTSAAVASYEDWERPIKLLWQLALLGIKVGLWLIVFFYITDVFPQARSWRYTIISFLTAKIIDFGNDQYSAVELLTLLGLAVGLWFVANAISQLFRRYVLHRARLDQRIQDVLCVLVQYALIFLGTIVLLQIWGIDISSLAILASVLGVGIGFGVQNITNNFISGFIITLERPIQIGDFINVGELVGTVMRVGARSTEICTLDQVTIIVPNSRFLESEVINWSHGNPVSRLRVPVGVAYGSDIALVKIALLEAVKRHPEVLVRPPPEVWFQGFGDSSLDFEIMVWTGEPRKQFRVRSDLNYEIESSLRRYGIEIPFPQRDLHVRSPQLDELVGLLKQWMAGSLGTQFFNASPEMPPLSITAPRTQSSEMQAQHASPSRERLSNLDLTALVETMKGPQGVEVHDLHYQSQVYPACFTGAAAVEWLIQYKDFTREEAIVVGQWLFQKEFIRGSMDVQSFEDSQYFYQFHQVRPANSEPANSEKETTSISEHVTLYEDDTEIGLP